MNKPVYWDPGTGDGSVGCISVPTPSPQGTVVSFSLKPCTCLPHWFLGPKVYLGHQRFAFYALIFLVIHFFLLSSFSQY